MQYIITMMFAIVLTGCTLSSDANYLVATGKKPPMFFHVTDMHTMNTFVFDTKRFSVVLPEGKKIDFKDGRYWRGGSHRDGNSIGVFNGPYHVDIFTNYYPRKITPKDTAILQGAYTFRPQRTVDGKYERQTGFINTHIEHHGKENYPCVVSESRTYYKKYKLKKYEISYRCYKFNPSKTKVQTVSIRLTYTKPRDAKLAKQYTYRDLKRRAKRMLDSLYIKDWWN